IQLLAIDTLAMDVERQRGIGSRGKLKMCVQLFDLLGRTTCALRLGIKGDTCKKSCIDVTVQPYFKFPACLVGLELSRELQFITAPVSSDVRLLHAAADVAIELEGTIETVAELFECRSIEGIADARAGLRQMSFGRKKIITRL